MKQGMELPAAVRGEIERIVGPRNVSSDAGVLSGYSWNTGIGTVPSGEKFADVWPIAAVLPGSTDEVAALVKCFLRHGLTFKAHSTGYGSMSNVMSPDTVVVDLRRMDTLEIDAKNRMAIIGPYVTAGKLQAEAFKHGLTCHIVGAGPAHSPLASATSLIGVGITSQSTSMNARNLLSWEWVTPQGDIVRGGSAGSDCGWFAGDGPGPGVRGMLRGFIGASGGLGIFTKIGYKLYPVPLQGPPANTGRPPQIGMAMPQNYAMLHAVWPDWEQQREASFELTDAGVASIMLRIPPDEIGWMVTATNAEYVEKATSACLPPVARLENGKHWAIVTASRSAAEHAWRTSVVQDIVQRTGGRLLEIEPQHAEVLLRNLVTSIYIPRVLRPAGGITTTFGVLDSFHFLPRAVEAAEETLAAETKPGGKLVEGGSEEHWIWPHEGRYFWAENIVDFDPASKESRYVAARSLLSHFAISFRDPVGVLTLGMGPVMDLQGDKIGAPQEYVRGVKNRLDPGDASRSGDFIIVNMPKVLKVLLPLVRPLILSRFGLAALSRIIVKKGM